MVQKITSIISSMLILSFSFCYLIFLFIMDITPSGRDILIMHPLNNVYIPILLRLLALVLIWLVWCSSVVIQTRLVWYLILLLILLILNLDTLGLDAPNYDLLRILPVSHSDLWSSWFTNLVVLIILASYTQLSSSVYVWVGRSRVLSLIISYIS